MSEIAYNQIFILLFQCLIIATLILSLFRLRSIFGLSLLFTALGVFQFMQVFLHNSLYFQITPGILVSPGTVVFSGSLFAILLIYIREDALEARKVIYAILFANFILTFMQILISWKIEGEGILNVYNLPKEFFTQQTRVIIIGTLALFLDAFIVILIYETISRYVSSLFLRIFFSMAIVLSIDSLIFNFGVSYGTGQILNNLISHLTSKIPLAFFYSMLFTFYLVFLDKRTIKSESKSNAFNDIFSFLTYRQKYELVFTEKETQKKELQVSQDRLKTMFDEAPLGIGLINSLTGDIIEANKQYCKIVGLTSEEIKSIDWMQITHPDDVQEDLDNMALLNAGKIAGFDMKKRYIRPNGSIVWINMIIAPIPVEDKTKPLHLCMIEDITEQRRIVVAEKESRERFYSLFEYAPDGIFISTPEGNYIEVNQTGIKLLGYSKEELIGMHISSIVDKAEIPRVKPELEEVKADHSYNREWKFIRKDKSTFIGEVYSTILPDGNLLGILRDITNRKKAEEELKKYRENLEELVKKRTEALSNSQNALLNLVDDLNIQSKKLEISNKQLSEINEELETFTYSVSHDLKAPLRGIDGYSQLLIENYKETLNPEAQKFLMNIRHGTEQMNVLIEDLLAYSRMERRDFQMVSIYLNPLVDNILHQFSKIISENKIQIDISFPEEFMLIADKEGLQLALRNLIDNAIKFSKTSKKTIIEIGGEENESFWHIFVKDNGIGFDMKYHDRIFKIFQRLHLTEEYEGTGIGLAMVHKAMHRMNGKVWAESKLKEGTCFHLEINKTK